MEEISRQDLLDAWKYFIHELKFERSQYGNAAIVPYFEAALEACTEKLWPGSREKKGSDAVEFFKEERDRYERAPEINGCEMNEDWSEGIRMCDIAISLLEGKEYE